MQILPVFSLILGLCWTAVQSLFGMYLVVQCYRVMKARSLACVITVLFTLMSSLDLIRVTQLLGIPLLSYIIPINWFWWILRVCVYSCFYGGLYVHGKMYVQETISSSRALGDRAE